jgi:hypothetical protein
MEWDGETGLYCDKGMSGNNPLYEDSKTGRYLSRQSGFLTGLNANPYTSGNGNPWKVKKTPTITKMSDMASPIFFR